MFAEYLKNGLQGPEPRWVNSQDENLIVGYSLDSRTFYAKEGDERRINYENMDRTPFLLEKYYFMKILLMTTGLLAATLSAAAYTIRTARASRHNTKLY